MIDIQGKERDNQTPRHEDVYWSYPEIYDRARQSTLTIHLSHTRASDGIRIKYDSERDGWIIEQASIFEWVDDTECNPDWQEVAFVKSWARDCRRAKNT